MQVHAEVRQLLPDVQYNAAGGILTLRTPGVRKQPRLPGQHPFPACHLSNTRGTFSDNAETSRLPEKLATKENLFSDLEITLGESFAEGRMWALLGAICHA